MNKLPDNFPETLTGLDLLRGDWIGIAEREAGIQWPEGWQQCTHWDYWESAVNQPCNGYKYRPNPEALKTPAPRVGWMYNQHCSGVELTPEVRRRLGKDGGVDGNDVFRVCYALHREENDMDAVDAAEKIMQLIADSEVKIDE